ncbi:MAG: phage holin family protein [Prosthecochloris sp.]|uniref:Phage holin family protein n=1 Tax=Prosthecochloris aestuarii (strain DSM 271 / SK 413) TaxID=290512 RepID=B4S4Y0_PROA2|nr:MULTISPECIES: hypothetical protein [Prosthecochloris]ACF45478.1 conserved hypothetical protein [Prosthecochloris aestuarii DSM 271]MCW8798573.1 phage holin family protein [Prosthecochloris sp.]NEX12442.1 hypothetical protein [Prosthecochloris sp.]RDD30997.1 hypothetical protein CR161_09970 [Prosthecochloris sp. ZM]
MSHFFSREKQKPATGRDEPGIAELISNTITESYDDLLDIIDAKAELIKIELTEKLAIVGALLIMAILLLAGIIYLFTSIALLVGELLGHMYLGYLILSSCFLLCVLFFTKIRPSLLKNMIHKILLSTHGTRH